MVLLSVDLLNELPSVITSAAPLLSPDFPIALLVLGPSHLIFYNWHL